VERISHRELRNNSGEVLRRVQAGEIFEITNNGVVVATLAPAKSTLEINAVRLPDSSFKLSKFVPADNPTGKSLAQELIDERDKERL
jgi:prevent-host-death family protein